MKEMVGKTLVINVKSTPPLQLGLFLIWAEVEMKKVICFILHFDVHQGGSDIIYTWISWQ